MRRKGKRSEEEEERRGGKRDVSRKPSIYAATFAIGPVHAQGYNKFCDIQEIPSYLKKSRNAAAVSWGASSGKK
jgi:hypothetical protein